MNSTKKSKHNSILSYLKYLVADRSVLPLSKRNRSSTKVREEVPNFYVQTKLMGL